MGPASPISIPIPAISATNANTIAAGLSFISFLCLLIVNLGTPMIKSIYIAIYEANSTDPRGSKVIYGIYGFCDETSTLISTKYSCMKFGSTSYAYLGDYLDYSVYYRSAFTQFLLYMHAMGVVTSFMLICVGIYSRSHIMFKYVSWLLALFSSFIITLAMGGQIDNLLKIQKMLETPPIGSTTKTVLAEPTEHVRIGGVAFVLVLIPLLLSLLSAFAFYVGEQRAAIERGDIDGFNHDNHNENMCTGFTNQPPVPQYQQYNNDQSSNPQFATKGGDFNDSKHDDYNKYNYDGNMSAGLTNQPPSPQYQQYNNDQSSNPQSATNRDDINGSNYNKYNYNGNMNAGSTNQPPSPQYQQYNNDQSSNPQTATKGDDIDGSNYNNYNRNMSAGLTNQPPSPRSQQYNNDQSSNPQSATKRDDINGSNYNRNMSAGLTNQPPSPRYQQYNKDQSPKPQYATKRSDINGSEHNKYNRNNNGGNRSAGSTKQPPSPQHQQYNNNTKGGDINNFDYDDYNSY